MDIIQDIVIPFAASPLVYVVVLFCVIVDAFFPPLPSETVVVALASLATSAGVIDPPLLVLAAGVGAIIGDNITYLIGKLIGKDRLARARHPAIIGAAAWARKELDRRAAVLIFTARYIPMGRTATNIVAGASNFPARQFFPLSMLAGTAWALYTVLIGMLAGAWLQSNPILGIGLAILLAVGLGWAVDAVRSALVRHGARAARRRIRARRNA